MDILDKAVDEIMAIHKKYLDQTLQSIVEEMEEEEYKPIERFNSQRLGLIVWDNLKYRAIQIVKKHMKGGK